jgi:hypothetical protein
MNIPGGRPPKHPVDYMMAVAEEVANGMSYRDASKRFRVSHGSISHWLKKYSRQGPRKKPAPPRSVSKTGATVGPATLELENRLLKQELGELYLEIKLLKKAQAFAEQARKEDSSIVTSENFGLLRRGAK